MQQGKRVQVLMSTYRGARYLREQLDSIIRQSYDNWFLTIRDDGSADETVSILKEYADAYPQKIRYETQENVGACRSFIQLAKQEAGSASFYAFCDQDDVWKEDKLQRAVEAIERVQEGCAEDVPVIYCSALDVVDEQLQRIQTKDLSVFQPKMTFANALVENVCTGCTMVINEAALRGLCDISQDMSDKILMHDWWLYLYGTCFGRVIYDSYAGILYRQHQNNVIGETVSPLGKMWRKIISFRGNRGKLRGQIEAFYQIYGAEMPHEQVSLVQTCLSMDGHFLKRVKMAGSGVVYRLSCQDNLICRLLILAGWL